MTEVYMIVSRDRFRLPRWWGVTAAELARLSGRSYASVRSGISRARRNGGRYGCYEVVRIQEGE